MTDNVTLYIATHNITGIKYFGKTKRWFTEKDLQENYHGSGPYWVNHLKKYGDDVTMEIYGIFSLNEEDGDYVEPIALKFSEENDIVESDEWRNQNPENGLGGGVKGQFVSEETIQKQKEAKQRVKENGKTVAQNASEKTAVTMAIRQENGLTKREMAEMKRNETVNNDETFYERRAVKFRETYTKVQENGLSKAQEVSRKNRGSKYYNIYDENNNLMYSKLIKLEIYNILGTKGLHKYNKDKRMGSSSRSKSMLKKLGNEHLIGWYSEEI